MLSRSAFHGQLRPCHQLAIPALGRRLRQERIRRRGSTARALPSGHGLRCFELLTELGQLGVIQIGYGPERHAVADPVMNMESSNRLDVGTRERVIRSRRDEHVNRVLPALVDERSHRPPAEVIETPSDEWKADRGEINDRWSEIELAKKPWLDRVLICGRNVE